MCQKLLTSAHGLGWVSLALHRASYQSFQSVLLLYRYDYTDVKFQSIKILCAYLSEHLCVYSCVCVCLSVSHACVCVCVCVLCVFIPQYLVDFLQFSVLDRTIHFECCKCFFTMLATSNPYFHDVWLLFCRPRSIEHHFVRQMR